MDDERLNRKLRARARAASARARELIADAEACDVKSRVPVRCAWCERIALGGLWRREDEIPAYFLVRRRPDAVSHGICEECVEALRKAGLSR